MKARISTLVVLLIVIGYGAMVLSPLLKQSRHSRFADAVSDTRLDQIMLMPDEADPRWSPDTFLDIRYPWPEKERVEFGQPFEAWTFAKNSAAVRGLARSRGRTDTVTRMARYLSFVAERYTRRDGTCVYVTSEFAYPYLWSHFERDFKGAFMNAVTAYGYLYLYEATGEDRYLRIATSLLRSAAVCESDKVQLHSIDGNGRYWLNHYVFNIPAEDEALFRALGFEQNRNGTFRARVINGHIHALLALMKFAKVANSAEFDDVIEKAIDTARHYLPSQLYKERYFSYQAEFRRYPDHAQERAVLLAEGLCEIANDRRICGASRAMRAAFDGSIRRAEKKLYAAGYRSARKFVAAWRAANP